jgi:hypothetical protein
VLQNSPRGIEAPDFRRRFLTIRFRGKSLVLQDLRRKNSKHRADERRRLGVFGDFRAQKSGVTAPHSKNHSGAGKSRLQKVIHAST